MLDRLVVLALVALLWITAWAVAGWRALVVMAVAGFALEVWLFRETLLAKLAQWQFRWMIWRLRRSVRRRIRQYQREAALERGQRAP